MTSNTNGRAVVSGQVLDIEHKRGEFEGRAYDFRLVHVLAGRKVLKLRVNPDNADYDLPREGDFLTVEVDIPEGVRPIVRRSVAAAPTAVKTA